MTSKIVDLETLRERLQSTRAQGRRIVQCHGVFDLLHIGHIHHFQAAREFGDLLIVTITPDRFVNKGPGRPVFGEGLRAQAIAALECVDFVAVNEWPTAVEPIALLRPDFYCKGSEYSRAADDVTGKISDEEAAVLAVGGKLVFTHEPTQSSSHLLNHFWAPGPDREYLDDFARRHQARSLIACLNEAGAWKVLVTGDSYWQHTATCQSRAGESTLHPRVQILAEERRLLGVPGLARHLEAFCAEVVQVSIPSATQRRFLSPTGHNLFETWEGASATPSDRLELEQKLDEQTLVVVHDLGLGGVDEPLLEWLAPRCRFLVLDSQGGKAPSRRAGFTIGSDEQADLARSGDGGAAFVALASLCAAAGQTAEVAALVGLAAEQLKQDPVDRIALCKYLEVLLK